MSKIVSVIRLFVAAPSDIEEERKVIAEIIDEWNIHHGTSRGVVVDVLGWKTHSHPSVGDRPQAIINRQVLDSSDIVVGIFWSRFGTPTGKAGSGTEEEIKRSISSGKKVMLYFSDKPIPPSCVQSDQYQKILAFKSEFEQQGLYWTYSNLTTFREDFRRHISEVLAEFLSELDATRIRNHQETQQSVKIQKLRIAIGVVQEGSKVLMVRRRVPEGNLVWQFPAGIIKPSMSNEDAIINEIKKETGVSAQIVEFIGKRIHPDTKVESFYYHCKYLHGKAENRDKEENSEVKWVEATEVESYVTSNLYSGIKRILHSMEK